jgi:hypothetical protein
MCRGTEDAPRNLAENLPCVNDHATRKRDPAWLMTLQQNPCPMLFCSSEHTTTKRKQAIMSKNGISYDGAELAHVETRTAKSGNTYANGILILRDENGKYEASLRFRSFNAVDALSGLEKQYFTKHSPSAEASGGDLHFDAGESTETRERTVAKATARPRVSVAGWFKTSKVGEKWDTVFMLESVSI